MARRELGIPTAFNFLGPLTNPAQPPVSAVGVADRADGADRRRRPGRAAGATALVFRGDDGLDELTTAATSRVWVVARRRVAERVLDPRELGVPRRPLEDLRGGDPAYNAAVARACSPGTPGRSGTLCCSTPPRPLVAADAHEEKLPADVLAGDLDDRLRAALEVAAESVDTGTAASVLDRWVAAAGH